jgi:SAM-dependent methyltransferase
MTRASSSRVAKLSPKTHRIAPPKDGPFRIRLAGALQPRLDGFLGVDSVVSDSIDHVVDLKRFPWPIHDGTVDTLYCEYYFHRLDNEERHSFVNECYNLLKVGGQLIMVMPHWSSEKAYSDPFMKMPPLAASSFVRYNKEWREQTKTECGLTCDFDIGPGYGMEPDVQLRNQEYQQHAIKYWVNAAIDLHVTLTKKS